MIDPEKKAAVNTLVFVIMMVAGVIFGTFLGHWILSQ